MKQFIFIFLTYFLGLLYVKADRIYVINGSGYNHAEYQLINVIKANGHTVVNDTLILSLPVGFTSTCVDPVNGYDWLCFFGNVNYTIWNSQIKNFIDAGGKVFYQYEVTCCTASSASVAPILSSLTGLSITPDPNPSIASAPAGWTATSFNCCANVLGGAYKGLNGVPVANQFQATANLNSSFPLIATCLNFGCLFTTTDFVGTANQGAFVGLGDVNVWYFGLEPFSNGGTGPIDTALVNFFFPGPSTTCYLLPEGCLTTYTPKTCSSLSVTTAKTNAICNGGNTGSATVTAVTGTADYTYSWSTGASSITSSAVNTLTGLAANTYTVTITDSGSNTTTTTITITQPAVISLNASQQVMASCGAADGQATANASGGNGSFNYTWSNGSSGVTANNLATGIYTVTVTDINNCTQTATTTIQNANGPVVSITQLINNCPDSSNGLVKIAVSGGSGAYTYSWSNGQSIITTTTTSQISNLSSNTYTVTVADAGGCSSTTTATVIQYPNTIANAGSDQTITNGQSIQLSAGTGASYLWTPATTLNNAAIFNPIANPTQTTTYTVMVTDVNNCTAVDSVTIMVVEPTSCELSSIFLPTAFSPNGDMYNDILYVRGPTCITEMRLQVFDRWGELVFTTTSTSIGWDGIFRGKKMDSAVFICHLTATLSNGQKLNKKANVTLLR